MVPIATNAAKAKLNVADYAEIDELVDAIKAKWSRDAICDLLVNSDRAVIRALQILLARQTIDEQDTYTTQDANGVGFTQWDAKFYTAMAKRTLDGSGLSAGQIGALRKINKRGRPSIGKYWRQIQEEIVTKELAEANHA